MRKTTSAKIKSRHGFTLVELLVVMGIIAILAAVSLPVYSTIVTKARTAKCASNLRNIGSAMLSFAGDNNGNFPLSGGDIKYDTTGTGTQGWTQQLEPYLGTGSAKAVASGSIYQCPDASKVTGNTYYSYFNGAHAAYAQAGGFAALNLMRIHSPSAYIIAGDISASGLFSIDDADKDDFNNDPAFQGFTSTSTGTSPILIHGATVNIAFADGHVENVKSFNPLTMTTVYMGPGASYNYLYTGP